MHFTYEPNPRPNLSQGDVIQRTPAVEEMLEEVHPHYFQNRNNAYFVVLTQSCDLVRRDGKSCKARYISIAAARPLTHVIDREIAKYQQHEFEKRLGLCSKAYESKIQLFVERLLNNNEEN